MFGFNDWETWRSDGFCTRSAKVTRLLSYRPEIEKIIVISTSKSILTKTIDKLRGRSLSGKVIDKGIWFQLRQVDKKIFALDHYRILPKEERYGSIFKLNNLFHATFLRRHIKKYQRSLNMENNILWLANPLMEDHIGNLDEEFSVFDAIDDWRIHPQKAGIRKSLIKAYGKISKKSDLIFSVSKSLRDEFLREKDEVYWIPNGVDVDFFKRAREVPRELANLKKPIIEYVGVVQDRLDVELLKKIATRFKDASVVLIGPVQNRRIINELRCHLLNNISYLGRIDHIDIPGFMQAADVCIIPHVKNKFTVSMNPLKVYEYLAAGKPVVSTCKESMEVLSDLVYFADNTEQFVDLVNVALRNGKKASDQAHDKFLKYVDWDYRIEEMMNAIESFLKLRQDDESKKKEGATLELS